MLTNTFQKVITRCAPCVYIRRWNRVVSIGIGSNQETCESRTYATSSIKPKPQYNVGIFGCGRIAGVHLNNVLRNRRLNLQWIVENNTERIKEVKREFLLDESIPFYSSSERGTLLAEKNLDAVLVISPTNTHTDYICDSLNHGRAVFTEKPAGECMADIKQCFETAERHGLPFLTGYVRRFDSAFRDVYNAVQSGAIGTVQAIKTTTRDSPKPSYEFLSAADSTGCNILGDLAVHDIDMMVWLTGARRPESILISCHIHDDALKDVGEPDCLAGLIKYPDGILVTMDAYRDSCYGYDIRLEVFGDKGMACADNPRENSTTLNVTQGGHSRRLFNSFPQRFKAPFEDELAHFVDCLDGKSVPLVKKEESLLVAEIIEKGVQSYKERRLVHF